MAYLTSFITNTPIPTPAHVSTKPKASLPWTRFTPIPILCSSRPQKKATAHHAKTRPKKTAPWDVKRRGPTVYPPLPPLPPDWTLVESGANVTASEVEVAEPPEEEEEESD